MKIREIFETRIEEKFDPVIKVGETQDEAKLVSEIETYVVTPAIERFIDDFLEHYVETARQRTTEVGAWISGYFGSGKSHLAKILALLVENRSLRSVPATKRFEARISPDAPRRSSIVRNLTVLDRCSTQVLAFNLNTLVDSKSTPLPRLLLSQYYQAKGYSSNLVYARVIEQELDQRGKLGELHAEVARLSSRSWDEIKQNPTFYRSHLYKAVCALAPEEFASPEDVENAVKTAEKGDLYNVQLLVDTVIADLERREAASKKPCRLLLVLDESGQWIEDDAGRLTSLQALVEEAAIRGQGKVWIFVTTHEDMGAIYQNARARQADMKKLEGRFRFKWSLTTENIELVLEDRVFKKKLVGRDEVGRVYDSAPGVLRGLGELPKVEGRALPACDRDRFIAFYPFFPYQIHLIPEVVKSLRSRGGRGEQLSGSTRTLLAISQDVLRAGRRPYLSAEVGEIVSFDEVYGNLAGEGEVSPDARRELSNIDKLVTSATPLTRRVAEVLYLARELPFVPRTIENLGRFLVESTTDDLAQIVNRLAPELERLIRAKMVARIGDEFEFLTGERRTFEEEVATRAAQLRQQDRAAGFAKHFILEAGKGGSRSRDLDWLLGFATVEYKGVELPVRVSLDGTPAISNGDVHVCIYSPLEVLAGVKVVDLEEKSITSEESHTIFVVCDRVPGVDQELSRYLAMKEVIEEWKGDARRSEEARLLAEERDRSDLQKLKRRVESSVKDGLKGAHVIFRGSSRALAGRPGQTPGQALRSDLASYFPSIYTKLGKVPTRITNEREAIRAVLAGERDLSPDVRELKLFDRGGALDPQSPVVDEIRLLLSQKQSRSVRTLGRDLLDEFSAPPYGWDGNAVRVAVAACVRAGVIKLVVNKAVLHNPADERVHKALRDSREFDRTELVLEDTEIASEAMEDARKLLIKLTGKRKIDETPAALHEVMEGFGREKLGLGQRVKEWAEAADFPLPGDFAEALEVFTSILGLTNPLHRVKEVHSRGDALARALAAVDTLAVFHEKWRGAFIDASKLASQLHALAVKLPREGPAIAFLGEFGEARRARRLADPQVWKGILSAKAAAEVELRGLVEATRSEAAGIAGRGLERLQAEFGSDLAGEEWLQAARERLDALLDSSADGADLVRALQLPDLIRGEIGREANSLERALAAVRSKSKAVGTKDELPPREVRKVRMADLAARRRIRDAAEWAAVLQALDSHIRDLLAEYDVELD